MILSPQPTDLAGRPDHTGSSCRASDASNMRR